MSDKEFSQALSKRQIDRLHALLDEVAERQRKDFGHIVSDVKPDGTLITMFHYLKNSNREIEEVLSTTKFEDVPSD